MNISAPIQHQKALQLKRMYSLARQTYLSLAMLRWPFYFDEY